MGPSPARGRVADPRRTRRFADEGRSAILRGMPDPGMTARSASVVTEGGEPSRTSGPCRPTWRPWARHVVVVPFAWLAVVVLLTWPLGGHLSTRLPDTHPACRFDALLTAWAGAWETEALVRAPSTLLDANLYHPVRHSLLFVEAGFGALPLFAPVYLATHDPALALNATFLLGAALTAASIHLVVGAWTGSFAGGLVAAWCFLSTRWVLWSFGPTAPNYVVLFWLPPILFLAARGRRGWREPTVLAVLVALQSLVSVVYLAVATVAPLAVLAARRLLRRATRPAGLRLAGSIGMAIVPLAPLYLGLLGVRRANPGLDRQTWWSVVQPTSLPLGPFRDALSPLAVPPVAWLLVAVGLAIHSSRGSRGALRGPWRHGALWLSVGLLASLSRELEWGGARLPGPLGLLGRVLPQVMALRVTARIGIAGAMGLALLVGTAFAEIERLAGRRLRPRSADAATAVLAGSFVVAIHLLAEHGIPTGAPLPSSYPTAPAIRGDSRLLAMLRASGRPVVELGAPDVEPANEFTGIVEPSARAMYRSIFHRAPILDGYGSFWPAGWLERMTLARRAPAPGVIGRLAEETGLAHVLVHARGLSAEDRARWLASPELRLSATEGDDLLFDVVAPAAPVASPASP